MTKDGSFCDFQADNYLLLVDRASNHPDLHSHASPRPPKVRVSSLCQGDLNINLFSTMHARRSNKTKSIFLRRSKWQTKRHHCSTALLQVTFFYQPQIVLGEGFTKKSCSSCGFCPNYLPPLIHASVFQFDAVMAVDAVDRIC